MSLRAAVGRSLLPPQWEPETQLMQSLRKRSLVLRDRQSSVFFLVLILSLTFQCSRMMGGHARASPFCRGSCWHWCPTGRHPPTHQRALLPEAPVPHTRQRALLPEAPVPQKARPRGDPLPQWRGLDLNLGTECSCQRPLDRNNAF